MGSKKSKPIVKEGEIYNVDTNTRKRFLTGLQMARTERDGIEGNFQIAFSKTKVKKYEPVDKVCFKDTVETDKTK